MAPRLPVERRVNEETGVDEARCRGTCRLWMSLDQFSHSIVRNNTFHCKQCCKDYQQEHRRKISVSGSVTQVMIRQLRARERKRGKTFHLHQCEVDKILKRFGNKCCLTETDKDITISQLDSNSPITYENAVVVTKCLDRALFKGDALVRSKLAKMILALPAVL